MNLHAFLYFGCYLFSERKRITYKFLRTPNEIKIDFGCIVFSARKSDTYKF